MCCFSGRVKLVAATNIFARATKLGKQILVYSLIFKADEDLALILPIPTPKGSKDDAVRFIPLKDHPRFFEGLEKVLFPFSPRTPELPKLKVVEVGAFEASFVPKAKDFARLDERFRIPEATWDKLPAVKDFGFAVFKLKKGESKVHPMAFEFPRADDKKLFFPTVHIHDGKIHKTANFDHALYCQIAAESVLGWKESAGVGSGIVDTKKAGGVIDPDGHVYQMLIKGRKDNKDTWLA